MNADLFKSIYTDLRLSVACGLFSFPFDNKRIVRTSSCGTVLLTSGVPSYRQNRRFPSV